LHDAGVSGYEDVLNSQCSTFFGSQCATYTELWDRLFEAANAAPSQPPPPILPFDSDGMYRLAPTRIFFDGGLLARINEDIGIQPTEIGLTVEARQRRQLQFQLDSHKYITGSDNLKVIARCTDGNSLTLCAAESTETAWIKYDFGEPVVVKGVEIVNWPFEADVPQPPPSPPPIFPSPDEPVPDAPQPPLPPPSPLSPPPSPPRCTFLTANDCVVNHIDLTNDGVCSDGGTVALNEGLHDAVNSLCELGTDTADCGVRCAPLPPPAPPFAPGQAPIPLPLLPPPMPPAPINPSPPAGNYGEFQLFPGSGDTKVYPDKNWEMKMEFTFADVASGHPGTSDCPEHNIGALVTDFTMSSDGSGLVSADPQNTKGCYLWQFGVAPDGAGGCLLEIIVNSADYCSSSGLSEFDDYPYAGGNVYNGGYTRQYFVLNSDNLELDVRHTLSLKIISDDKDMGESEFDYLANALRYGLATQYEVRWDDQLMPKQPEAGTYLDVPQGFLNYRSDMILPDKFVYFYTTYIRDTSTKKIQYNPDDIMHSFQYGLDIAHGSASGNTRRRELQTGYDLSAGEESAPETGPLEVWGSDSSSFFGTRLLTLPNGVNAFDRRLRIETNGATYRYLTLRAYRPDDRLRIDSLNFYGTTASGVGSAPSAPPVATYSTGRRLDEPEEPNPLPELKAIYNKFLAPMGYKTAPKSLDEAFTLVEHFLVKNVGPLEQVNRSTWPSPKTLVRPQNDETDGYENVLAVEGWWLSIESIEPDAGRGIFGSYPLRSAPNARIASPSHSLAVALSLKNESNAGLPNLAAAATLLVNMTCSHIGRCERTEHSNPLLDFEPSQWYFEDHPRFDDGAIASWTLAAVIAPSVDALLYTSLFCASPGLCIQDDSACALCNQLSLSKDGKYNFNCTVADVVAEIELQLLGGAGASQDPLACARDVDCLQAASERAASALDTFAFSDSGALKRVANANAELLDGMVEVSARNATHNDTAPERLVLARKHAEAVGVDMASRLKSSGRRLESKEDEDAGPNTANFTANEMRMFVVSSAVRDTIVEKQSLENVSTARQTAVRVWAAVGAIGDWPGNKGPCADPQLPNKTISCSKFFSLTAKFLKRMRVDIYNIGKHGTRRRKLTEDSHKELTEHVERNLDNVCCAKFELDGREECDRKYCELHTHQESARRMAVVLTKKHPDALDPSAHAMIENVLLPHTHPNSQCHTVNKSTMAHGGPTRWECMGKSFVAHASKRYGIDPENVQEKIHAMGYSFGQGVTAVHKAMGMFHEVRSSGEKVASSVISAARQLKAKNKAQDAATAARMLKEARSKSNPVLGRRLQHENSESHETETDEQMAQRLADTRGVRAKAGKRRHGFGHVAKRIVHERKRARNESKGISEHFRRMEQVAQTRRLESMALGRAGGGMRVAPSRVDHFHADTIKKSVVSPKIAIEALQADESSLSSRFRNGFAKLNDVLGRWQSLHYNAQLQEVQRRRARRLEEGAPRQKLHASLYDQLEARDRKRAPHERGRRLEIPHNHRLSWVHDLVDWNALADEWTRLHDVFVDRNKMRMEGRSLHEIVHKHPAKYSVFDNPEYFSISAVGDAVRRMWHRKVNGTDHHFLKHLKSDEDKAGKHQPAHGARVRRLADGLFGPSLKAPYLFADKVLYKRTPTEYNVKASQDPIWTATLKYIVYSTVGCYFQAPQEFDANTQKGGADNPSKSNDGSTLKVLRVEPGKLCFPGVPIAIPNLPTWREFTKSEGVDYYKLTYEEQCTGSSYQQKALDFFETTLGISTMSDTARWLGIPGALRGAEALDSVKNFLESTQANDGESVTGHILCGMVELGGLLYVIAILISVSIAMPLIAGVNSIASIGYDVLVLAFANPRSSLKASLRGAAGFAARGAKRAGKAGASTAVSVAKTAAKTAAKTPVRAAVLSGKSGIYTAKKGARVYGAVGSAGVRGAGAVVRAGAVVAGVPASTLSRPEKRSGRSGSSSTQPSKGDQPSQRDNISKSLDDLFSTPVEKPSATTGFFSGIASRLGFGNYNEVSTSTSDDEDTDENLDYPPGKPPAHEYV
jgi:hypothetical protein